MWPQKSLHPPCPLHVRRAPQALKRAYRLGSGAAPLCVYRLYLRNTLEERLLQLSDRMKGLEGLFKQGHARSVGERAAGAGRGRKRGAEGLAEGAGSPVLHTRAAQGLHALLLSMGLVYTTW